MEMNGMSGGSGRVCEGYFCIAGNADVCDDTSVLVFSCTSLVLLPFPSFKTLN